MVFIDKKLEVSVIPDPIEEDGPDLTGPQRLVRALGAVAAAAGAWVAPQVMHYDAHDAMAPVPIAVTLLGIATIAFTYEAITGRDLNSLD